MTLDVIPMNPICPRCGGRHGIEVAGDGYEFDCGACHGHLICAIGDEGEMYPYHREDGSCGCNGEPHTCDMDEGERANVKRAYDEAECLGDDIDEELGS